MMPERRAAANIVEPTNIENEPKPKAPYVDLRVVGRYSSEAMRGLISAATPFHTPKLPSTVDAICVSSEAAILAAEGQVEVNPPANVPYETEKRSIVTNFVAPRPKSRNASREAAVQQIRLISVNAVLSHRKPTMNWAITAEALKSDNVKFEVLVESPSVVE